MKNRLVFLDWSDTSSAPDYKFTLYGDPTGLVLYNIKDNGEHTGGYAGRVFNVAHDRKVTFDPQVEFRSDVLSSSGTIQFTSDSTEKKNIVSIENAIDKIKKLEGVNYRWKDDRDTCIHAGFIAQEVEKVLPNLVKEHDGVKTISYIEAIPYLTEAIKTLSKEIEEQQKEIAVLRQIIEKQ